MSDWKDALHVPGAALIRRPTPGKIGHVAFSIGDGNSTFQARGANFGVSSFPRAKDRSWTIGCLLPGVDYTSRPTPLDAGNIAEASRPRAMPSGFLWLKSPNFKGPAVLAVQQALKAKRIDPGPIDGEFGPMTRAAVTSFQLVAGLEVDGVVGPSTAGALGLAFPIAPSPGDVAAFNAMRSPRGPARIALPATAAGSMASPASSSAGGCSTRRPAPDPPEMDREEGSEGETFLAADDLPSR